MPLQKKNTILAAITAAVFLLGFLVNDPFLLFEKSYEKSAPLIKSKADRVKKVTLTDAAGKRIFTRTTDGWTLELAGSPLGVMKADATKVETGLKNIFEARRYQEVSSSKDKQGDFEVRDQDYQILLEGENGDKIAQAILGKYSGAGNASFVRLADDTSVYAVKGFLRGDWNQDADQYRDRSILKIAKENIKEIQVSGKESFKLKADEKGQLMLDPQRATDKNRATTYANDLSDLTGVKFYKETNLPPRVGKITVLLSANVTKDIEFFGPTKEQEYIAKSTDAGSPLTVAKSKVDALFPRVEDLVDKGQLPNLTPPGK
jgi:hypothetical protein